MVGLLGGSFDPVHHGHLVTAVVLRERLGLSEVRLVPAGAQPFKARHVAPGEHRLRMVELAVAGHPGLTVERAELDRSGPSYMVDTLRGLQTSEPGESWTLMVGADAAADFSSWHEAEAIPELARVVFFHRAGHAPPEHRSAEQVDVPAIEISATDIRARVRDGRSIRSWVPDAVAEYIAMHRLYVEG
jgi:nicotinate-nucleotide adenylyltransferase